MDKPRVDSERELEELRLRVQELKILVERLQMTREALRDSEERYGMLFGKMLAGCALREIICDEDGKPVDYRFLEVNPSFERMVGLEQLEGRLGTELFPRLRDLSFDWLGVYGEVALEGIEANIEQYFEPTGRWYLISAYSPQEGQFATTCWDITDTKRTEERLRREQKFLATVLDTVGALVMVLDKTGRIVRFNRASETLSGYSFGEVRDLCLWDVLITPKAVDQVRGYFGDNNLSSFPSRCETYLMTKSGEYRLVDWSNSFLFDDNGSIEFVVCSGTDITERRRINNALRESEARLRAFVNSLPDVSLILDEDGRCVEVLASEESLSKQDLYGWKGQLLHNVLSRKDADRFLELIHRTLKTNRAEMMEYSIVANGERHWLEARMSPVLNIAPDKRTVVCITRDITERKLAEEALQQREREFKALVENAPDVIARFDRDCRFLYVNAAAERELGIPPVQLVGKTTHDMGMSEKWTSEWQSSVEAVFETGEERTVEFRYRSLLGTKLFHSRLAPEFTRDGRVTSVLGIIHDITERRQTEERIKYLSRHDSLTCLYNRSHFDREIERIGRESCGSVGVIVCDIDGLKLINDSLGLESGDRVLVSAAQQIRDCFRENDLVARVGGDEFAVILPDSSQRVVEEAGQRVREALVRPTDGSIGFALTMSVGFAVGRHTDVVDVFREAENNMNREKLHHRGSTRSAIVQALIKALEARDFITEGHGDRLQDLMCGMARLIGLREHRIADLRLFGQFHDIGKVGIPDRILFKPGFLTPDELAEMRMHCEIGYRIASSAPDLSPIADWILKHHENWDGSGYPLGIKGEEIPLECRVLAIADAYDAMTNDRPYRKAMSQDEAKNELMRCSGTQFDPQLVPVFIDIIDGTAVL